MPVPLVADLAAHALIIEGESLARVQGQRPLPGAVGNPWVIDGEVPRLGRHAVATAVHAAIEYQRTANALVEHRHQGGVETFEPALVVAVDRQRVHVVLDDDRHPSSSGDLLSSSVSASPRSTG